MMARGVTLLGVAAVVISDTLHFEFPTMQSNDARASASQCSPPPQQASNHRPQQRPN